MTKLFEHTSRMVNIGLANELLLMCDHEVHPKGSRKRHKLGLDAWEVIDAAATKPLRLAQGKPLALCALRRGQVGRPLYPD